MAPSQRSVGGSSAPGGRSPLMRFTRFVVFTVGFLASVMLVAELVASALTPSQVKNITEKAHDLADEIGFNGVGDWILERGADGSDAEHEGEGDFLPEVDSSPDEDQTSEQGSDGESEGFIASEDGEDPSSGALADRVKADVKEEDGGRPRRRTHPLSVLQHATVADVRLEPFPHLVVKNALPPNLYAKLAGTFPQDDKFRRTSNGGRRLEPNVRYDIPAHKVISQNLLAAHWKEFIAYHTSQAFYEEVAELFAEGILRYRPDLYALAAKLQRIKDDGEATDVPYYELANITALRAVRGRGAGVNLKDADIKLECQVGINSPSSRGGTSVRGPHVDRRGELFAGLLYLKHPKDTSRGGDLRVYRCKGECKQLRTPAQKLRAGIVARAGHEQFDPKSLIPVNTVRYTSNTFVMFINNPLSVHAVSARSSSRISRRLINFTGEFNPTSAARSREGLCCNRCAAGRISRCMLPAKTDRIPDNNRFPQ